MIKDDKLFGYEVKRISGRKSSQTDVILKNPDMAWEEREKPREEQVEELKRENKTVSEIDKNLYSGIGEALFLLRYVNFSYFVYPKLEKLPNYNPDVRILIDQLFDKFLPIGLIEYFPDSDGTLGFEVTHEARIEYSEARIEYRFGAKYQYIIEYLARLKKEYFEKLACPHILNSYDPEIYRKDGVLKCKDCLRKEKEIQENNKIE
jgi:hypothetical protein